MLPTCFSRLFTGKTFGILLLSASLTFSAGCDLAKNQLKLDRSADMEMQDYRDAMAQRLPEVKDKTAEEASIPEMKSYMATPMDALKPMPLVSISVNQSVPLKDVLYEVASQANYDLELDPRITGSIIFTARNRPFDQVISMISESAGLRYKFVDDSVKIELDTPYHKIYKINYLSHMRTNTSSISNDVAVVSGEGADTGSKFKAESKSEADFWGEMDANLKQILYVNRNAGTLRTARDPRIQAVAEQPAPVEPVVLSADGEIAQAGAPGTNPTVQVQAPNAVLRVEPLPVDQADQPQASASGEDEFSSRYSMNKQAGVISVFATERLHKQVELYLDEIRKAVGTQVLIEAKVLEVTLRDEFSAGIDWQMFNIFDRTFNFGVDTVNAAVAPVLSAGEPNPISLTGSYISGDFTAAIQAISRFGTVHALASPRLTVLNNQSAVLNVARNQVYFEIDVSTTSTDAGITTDVDSSIRNVPEGVLINVQPSIDLDTDTVSMAVRPTVTRIEGSINDPAVAFASAGLAVPITSPIPIVNVQEFDSIIRMNSGQAIVMGGLIQDRTVGTQNGVPVLSEVPVVGGLFRQQIDNIVKTELVVLMKATIMPSANNVHQTDKDLYRTFSQDRRPLDM